MNSVPCYTSPIQRELLVTHPALFAAMLENGAGWNLLNEIRKEIVNAGISEYIFDLMRNDIVKGNFSVIYLDDRIVGDDPARIKAKKWLDKIRKSCFELRNKGWDDLAILTY